MLVNLHIIQYAVRSQPGLPPTQIHSQSTFPPNGNGSCHRGQRTQDTKTCPPTPLSDRPWNQRMAYIKNFTLGVPNIVIVCLPRKR